MQRFLKEPSLGAPLTGGFKILTLGSFAKSLSSALLSAFPKRRPQDFNCVKAVFRKRHFESLNPRVICVKEIAPMCVNATDRTIKAQY